MDFFGNLYLRFLFAVNIMGQHVLFSSSELETVKLARSLASFSKRPFNIYLRSSIGLGKTSFCRGFLRGLGYKGCVKSPTYTLVESYMLPSLVVYHFDFYRLVSCEEFEHIGVRDYFDNSSFCLVEWPNVVTSVLPKEDISISLEYHQLSSVRKITLEAFSSLGRIILEQLFHYNWKIYAKTKI